ncbi:hypothetical protein [Methylobacter sp.]|uniref:hypothetical protein n=1 Tax=Methylobacter sp. TaxID=2051955 RepID=UPI003DA5DA28
MAISEKTDNKTKVLVNVYEPLITIMKRKLDAACLKRDAYLDKALRIEACFLREEVTIPNSDKAKSYIAENLKQLKLKPLNMLLSTETVELMNEVCQEKNIPRDAFINRVFLLMIASDTVLEVLFDDENMKLGKKHHLDYASEYVGDELGFYNRANVLDSIEEFVEISPFWRLRRILDDFWTGLYSYVFKKNALNNLPIGYGPLRAENTIGFNTFMSDDEVSKQETHESVINNKAETDKLLALMQQEKQARTAKIKLTGEAK